MRPQTHIALIPDGHGPYDSPSAGGLRVTGNHQAPWRTTDVSPGQG